MPKSRKRKSPKRVLALPDLEQAKSAVLDSLSSASGQRTYDHAIDEFASAITWPDYFFQPLIDAEYQVVGYDNRGLGMSDWMDDWDSEHPYTLEDVASDGIAVLASR